MALNPPINHEGQPMRVEGEYFAILRKDMEIEVKIEGWAKLSAKGKLFVTTARLVFVSEKHASNTFKSFDIPLLNIYKEKFEQPIFGANYLSLKVRPLFNLIPGDAQVKIWFMSGGCQKFLDIFLQILPQIRKRKNEGADPNFIKDLTTGKLNSKYAYVDPSDPTYVFVTQPQTQQPNSQFDSYYSKFPDTQPGVDYAPPANQAGPTQAQPKPQMQPNYAQPQPTVVNYGQSQPSYGNQGVVIGTGERVQNVQPQTQQIPQPTQTYQDQGQQQLYPQFDNQAYNGQSAQQYSAPQVQPQHQYTYQDYQPQPYQPPVQENAQGTQQQQGQNQQQQQQRPNAGYYYGFWGPQLQRNY